MGEVEDQHPSDYCTTSNENVGGNSADDGITRSLDYNVRTLAQYCSQGNVRRGFQTGIESLDQILSGGIIIGTIFEVMGDAEYEKTKLVLSIAVNLLINSDDCTVIFIDTMKNFSAVAVFENFQARQIATDKILSFMTRIIVEDVYDFEQLNTLLTFTLEQVRNGVAYDLIIIDSMTALFYLLSPSNDGYNDYKLGMAEISKIVILLKELAANNITIVTTNTPTESTQNEEDLNEGDEEDEEDEVANYSSSQDSEVTEPEGGKFWESVPSIRIALTALDEDKDFDSENECLLRKIKVVKATFCPSNNKEAFVHISNAGVTSFVDDYSK